MNFERVPHRELGLVESHEVSIGPLLELAQDPPDNTLSF